MRPRLRPVLWRAWRAALGTWAALLACRPWDEQPPAESDVPALVAGLCSTRRFEDLSECQCLGPTKADSACETVAEAWVGRARALELRYDGKCLVATAEASIDFPEAAYDCDPDAVGYRNAIPCETECQIYHGDAELGEPCELAGRRMSTCSASLFCGADGRCHEPCDLPLEIEAGQPCGQALGYITEVCVAPLRCDPVQQVCVAPLALGGDCSPTESVCGADAFCSTQTSVCTSTFAAGAACNEHIQCASQVCDETCIRPDAFACANQYL